MYDFLGIDWVIAGSVGGKIWVWNGLNVKKQVSKYDPFDSFLAIWKERNNRAFDSEESSNTRLKDRWMHYFGSILLRHDIISDMDFGNVIHTLIVL